MRIYVCGNYGRRRGLTEKQCELNARMSVEWGRRLIERGHNPFIPNLFHWVHDGWWYSPSEDVYFDLVKEWIQFCEAVFIPPDEYDEQSGVRKEMKIAEELGIPIYQDICEL